MFQISHVYKFNKLKRDLGVNMSIVHFFLYNLGVLM